ncbi:MAG: type II secretion system F family protein [Gammaproteobacteria bacterium]|nr:type II secretion system F family protein [Gammaproteobacteria bacterium]
MARFYYKAVNQDGRIVDGYIEAANESDLELRVSNMDLDLIRYKTDRAPRFLQRSKVDTKELIAFTYHLEQLLNAGVPLIDALQDIRDSISQSALKDIASSLIENIGTGRTFSQALAQHPKIFGTVYINMVNVGETSGQLVKVLRDLTGMLRWQYELTAKAKKMMIYPMFVLVVVSAVIIFLMTYLVPQLIPFIKLAGEEIPWHTQLLIDVSELFKNYWYLMISLPVAAFITIKMMARSSPSLRQWVDSMKLKFPLFGPISYKIKLARFCNYFALMYASGITVLDSIGLGKRIMNNSVLENALDRVQNQISDGESISLSFANVGLFPALVVRMIRVGENTGAMSEALLNVSYFYDNEVKDAIETMEPAIMPSLTIFLGAIVGWIMLSIMGPIYDAVVSLSAL